jgi:hypothetical protein
MIEIEITINEQSGEMTTEINGMAGPGCEQIIDEIKKLVGQASQEIKKPEYHVRPVIKQQTRR